MATVRKNRIAGCPLKSEQELKTMGRGSFDYRTDSNSQLHLVRWFYLRWSESLQDSKEVDMYTCIYVYMYIYIYVYIYIYTVLPRNNLTLRLRSFSGEVAVD